MTKDDLVIAVMERYKLNRPTSIEIINFIIEKLGDHLEKGEKCFLRGLGTLSITSTMRDTYDFRSHKKMGRKECRSGHFKIGKRFNGKA